MADRNPMGCFTLFAVIVAALLFVFVLLPAGCSTAGFLTMLGLAKHAESAKPNPVSVGTKASPAPSRPTNDDGSELIAALRQRARWPMQIYITRQTTARGTRLEYAVESGREFSATGLTRDGFLQVSLAGEPVLVPFSDTDFVQRLAP